MEMKYKDTQETLSEISERLTLILQAVSGKDAQHGLQLVVALKDARKTVGKQETEIENLRAQCKKLQDTLEASKEDKKNNKKKTRRSRRR